MFFINQKYSYGGRVSCRYTTNKPFAAQQVDIFKGGALGVACILLSFQFPLTRMLRFLSHCNSFLRTESIYCVSICRNEQGGEGPGQRLLIINEQ